jgi:signal transduction histidine kinase
MSAEKKDRLDLGALLEMLCDKYAESGVAIRYEGPAQIPFLCRPDGIQRVFSNLMDSAIHFGKVIVVTATVRDVSICVDVADDGAGISPDRSGDVIEPFVRLDHARTERPGSVGLGLSIVDDIVRGHNGTLTLFNRRETGLTVRVTRPVSAD